MRSWQIYTPELTYTSKKKVLAIIRGNVRKEDYHHNSRHHITSNDAFAYGKTGTRKWRVESEMGGLFTHSRTSIGRCSRLHAKAYSTLSESNKHRRVCNTPGPECGFRRSNLNQGRRQGGQAAGELTTNADFVRTVKKGGCFRARRDTAISTLITTEY